MKSSKASLLGSCLVLAFGVPSLYAASITISPIYVSSGPDPNLSPSYAAYTVNAQTALTTGQTSVGGNAQTTPSAYNALGTGALVNANAQQITNTPFPSWLGVADPAGAASGEVGNYLFWGVVISGNGISLSQLTATQLSTDPLDSFGDPGQPGGLYTATYTNYSSDFAGITAGGNTITSGSSSQLVNEIVISGFAAAQSGYSVPTSGTDAQQLQEIYDAFSADLGNYDIDTCFYYGAATNSNPNSCDTVAVTNPSAATPEPSSLALAPALLFATLFLVLRKRFRAVAA